MYQSTQAPIALSTGTTSIVAADPTPNGGRRIKVLAAYIVATAATTFNFQSHTTTAIKTGASSLAANGVMVLPYNPDGWFTTMPGEALDAVVGTGAVAGSFNYIIL